MPDLRHLETALAPVTAAGKFSWLPMLRYVAELHVRSTRPATWPFPNEWEEIGPGYCYGPAFGHWDIVHAILDVLPWDAEHARRQILNNLAAQGVDGFLPGAIWMKETPPRWATHAGHPPVWPFAVQAYADVHGRALLAECLDPLLRQIDWFERNRRAESGPGFFYTDIHHDPVWESGVDEGVRFLNAQRGAFACVDATAHVFALYDFASLWLKKLCRAEAADYAARRDALGAYLREELFVAETAFFHDSWSARDPGLRCFTIESVWPLVVGAATPEQARSVVENHLLNPARFFTAHPLATVAADDPRFEHRMWRGPAWNSMTLWAARGCLRYGFRDAAARMLERALDCTAAQFERTGTVWEFYHSLGGRPEDVARKPHTPFNQPCRDYLGHNPLIAMALDYVAASAP